MTDSLRSHPLQRMQRKEHIDAFGAGALIAFSALFGLNQVVIKVVNAGLQPVFSAGLRSLGAMVLIFLWLRLTRTKLEVQREVLPWGVLSGVLFSSEFILLFLALDITTVARTSVIFYTMPVWLSLMAHFAIAGERLTLRKCVGLSLAFTGVCIVFLNRNDGGQASLLGDVMAVSGAICWAGLALVARATPFSGVQPAMQMFWQLSVSSVILLGAACFLGPFIRDFQLIHGFGMAFQIIAIGAFGFLLWFWLLKIYPANSVASFSFLSPVFGVVFGWLLLGEAVGRSLWIALALISLGLVLINRAARR